MVKAPAQPAAAAPDVAIAHRTRNAGQRDSAPAKDASQTPKDDRENLSRSMLPKSNYIPPPQRVLGPYEDLVKPPALSDETMDPVDFELRKFVGLIVKSTPNSPKFTQEFVDELLDLTASYMSHIITQLHKFTEVQRHHKAGVSDLQMCLNNNNISLCELYSEYIRTRRQPSEIRKYASLLESRLQAVLREYNAEKYTLDKDDPSLVFHANEQYEIAALVPRQSAPRTYIPSYFPDLPPDFTYQSTGSYLASVTDLKQIKLKLVEEARLNEKSLYKLIEDDVVADVESEESNNSDDDVMSISGGNISDEAVSPMEEDDKEHDKKKIEDDEKEDTNDANKKMENEKEEESKDKNDEDLMDIVQDAKQDDIDESTDNKTPAPKKEGGFDFVEYARKRRNAKEREQRQIEARRRKRRNNVFMRAERVFSAYASAPPTVSDVAYFDKVLQNGFRQVVHAMRSAEHHKKEKISRLLKEKAEREHEIVQQNGAFEFGFSFNPASLLDSDDDDEPHDIVFEEEKELDIQINGVSELNGQSGAGQSDHTGQNGAGQNGVGQNGASQIGTGMGGSQLYSTGQVGSLSGHINTSAFNVGVVESDADSELADTLDAALAGIEALEPESEELEDL